MKLTEEQGRRYIADDVAHCLVSELGRQLLDKERLMPLIVSA